jgi:hypothetical protein
MKSWWNGEPCKSDEEAFSRALRECLCDNADAVLISAVLIGTCEVSLWLLRADDGGEVGYGVKLKGRSVLAYPGEPLRNSDMKDLTEGLSWAVSALHGRCIRKSWDPLRP